MDILTVLDVISLAGIAVGWYVESRVNVLAGRITLLFACALGLGDEIARNEVGWSAVMGACTAVWLVKSFQAIRRRRTAQ